MGATARNTSGRDIFISYSTADASFVESLAQALQKRGVTLWLDRYEIKPGEYLRERINDGIANAKYFLAVLSPASIKSEWVKREIDSAMIQELDEKRVRLVPVLLGAVTDKDIPGDIRGKLYLDFRAEDKARIALERLFDLLKPELRVRKEYLKELRAGLPDRTDLLSGYPRYLPRTATRLSNRRRYAHCSPSARRKPSWRLSNASMESGVAQH